MTAAILAGLTVPMAQGVEYSSFQENETAQNQIANLSMYQLVLSKDSIPDYGSSSVGSVGWYDYANTSAIRNGFSGAIWYMQTTNSAGNVEWVLIDAPNYSGADTNAFYKLGIARNQTASDVVNMAVTGTNFYASYDTALMPLFDSVTANPDGVKAIKDSILLIESWPFNYNTSNKTSVQDENGNVITLSGASSDNYDWNDVPGASGNHGSYQFHIYDPDAATGQTVFGMGRLYRNNETLCVGIGNSNDGASRDWTMAKPTSLSGSRVLQALVVPNYAATDRIFNAASDNSDWSSASAWLGADGNVVSTPTDANDVFVNYGNLLVSGSATANMLDVTALGTLTVAESGSLTISGYTYVDGTETDPSVRGALNSAGTVYFKDRVRFTDSAVLNVSGGSFTASEFWLASDAAADVTANIQNATLKAGTLYAGYNGNADVQFNNSTFTGNVGVAQNDNSSGVLTITGADSFIQSTNFNVGFKGDGTLNLYDGTIKATSYFCIGNNQSYANGTVNQYGGLIESPWVPLGHYGQGTYNMFGGKLLATGANSMDQLNSCDNGLEIGDRTTANVTFNLYGGEIESKGYIYVGRVGKGVVNQSGGAATAVNFVIGHLAAGNGVYNISSGSLTVKGSRLNVGNYGSGVLNVSGDAVVTVGDRLEIGNAQNSTGTMNMTGGTVTANTMDVGNNGSGTLNLYDGVLKTNAWFLVGFNNQADGSAPNVVNQYGGTLNAGWFTMGWDGNYETNSQNSYNMFGGTLNVRGEGNPFVLAKNGKAVFNLYDGQVSAAVGRNSNQAANAVYYNGYGLKLGGIGSGTGVLNIYAGDMDVKGHASLSDSSEINFMTSVRGLGSLNVEGNFEQNGGTVSVAHNDSISLTDDYSLENGKDVMTVGGKSAVNVTNNSPNLLDAVYDSATGVLNVQFKDDLYAGSLGGNSNITVDSATAGWVSLDEFNNSNPFMLTFDVNTNGLGIDAFVDVLAEQLHLSPEDDWLTVEATSDNSVVMTFLPDVLDGMDILSWNFSDSALYGLNGVAVTGLSGNEVPEPSTIALLVLGCGLLSWSLNRKKC